MISDGLASSAPATWRLYLWAAKVTPAGQSVLMEGKEDVDMDILFARPEKVALKTEEVTRTSGCGLSATGQQGATKTSQTALTAGLAGGGCTAVLYPRLKTQKTATFLSLAGGKAVKIVSAAGTDFVFLNDAPFSFKEGDVVFDGTAGAAMLRGTGVVLSLAGPGSISAGGHELKADKPVSRRW